VTTVTARAPRKATQNIFQFDQETFRAGFPHKGFKTKHQLCDHPLFELSRLEKLIRFLPQDKVEYHSGAVGFTVQKRTYPSNGLSIADTIRRIEEVPSWVVLRNVEADPEYHELLHTMLAEVRAQMTGLPCEPWMSDMHRLFGFIFISSPGTITPCHVDDEHSFLSQVRGAKQIAMWDEQDRTVMSEEQAESMLEFFHDPEYDCYLPYKDEFLPRASMFDLAPGESLHFPFGAPHWVRNGNEVSISFSNTFRSLRAERQSTVYYINKKLRQMGVQPTPPFQSAWCDSVKFNSFLAARNTSRLLRGQKSQEKW
jgi:hypothetical protein